MSQSHTRQMVEAAKKEMMKRHDLSEGDAEHAMLAGFRHVLKLAGELTDESEVTLDAMAALMESGRYEEIEKRARASADKLLAAHAKEKQGGTFERRPQRNKFI